MQKIKYITNEKGKRTGLILNLPENQPKNTDKLIKLQIFLMQIFFKPLKNETLKNINMLVSDYLTKNDFESDTHFLELIEDIEDISDIDSLSKEEVISYEKLKENLKKSNII